MADAVMDFAAIEESQPAETTSQESTQDVSSAEFQPTTQDGQQPQQTEQPLDGRRGPQNIRQAIRAASEALPDQASHLKELGNAYFREQAYKQHFPTPQEAATAKQLLEGVGGLEGATRLQERAQQYDAQDNLLREGNPEVLEAMFKDFPEGAANLAGPYLDRLQQVNPAKFGEVVAPHALALLDGAGVPQFLENMKAETDPGRLQAMVKQLSDWMAGQKGTVQQQRQQPAKDPRVDKIAEREQALQKQQQEIFQGQVQTSVQTACVPKITAAADQYAKQYKLNDTQKIHFQEQLQSRIYDKLQKDPTYQAQLKLRDNARDKSPQKIADYIASEYNARIQATAFEVARDIYGASKPATAGTGVVKAGEPKTAPGGGPVKVSAEPASADIDWGKPNAQLMYIANKAYLKNGRFVSW